ncbi:2,3-bisphosphoglycerate-independent phosphoglycerate mutase [Rhodohalobacter barkolensis]|uniref:2,3-bisphosphoglycerate-independent phosphoglycerate mutase n=1 Tax=Rhodohalobacter barkolensis TaxID=2053187 RepID=A0A2N0VIF7_9BACT|nr:2,3-bisphosphoglycerate-independent phosphoglycerate mutase [Rhodohalobacter barkolensis]PKD43980.1 2,3-bisphosphoglycerate-independent phosphoglycerate mutase [Rhodohalobacter barkolensis]
MTPSTQKALLIVLDGYGIAENPDVSAIDKADTPFFDSLIKKYPHAQLSASGEDVGLPEGQFGNSEVGHLNIGAGRIVWQELSRINKSIREGDFFENSVLTEAFDKAKANGRIHFMGLFSDGGVHSHNEHLFALMEMAKKYDIDQAYVHAFTDGRDTSPHGGAEYLKEFEQKAKEIGTGTLASVVGRYYAMDRDKRWERTQKAYDLLVHGKGELVDQAAEAFSLSYSNDVTDEFILPHNVKTEQNSRIQKGDVVIFYNIRGDRARQITKALFRDEEIPFETQELDLHYVTFTSYDETFDSFVKVAFPPARLKNTLGEYVSGKGLSQLRIAETEKYPHVTYFFNGGEETSNKGEIRVMVPSPKVATYDLQPEMSAEEVTSKLCAELVKEKFDLAILNFANPDMVGHTGDMEATIKAVEMIDRKLKKVVETAKEHHYEVLIIADHGNADCMIQPDGSPHTSHTTAPVPVILVSDTHHEPLQNGILADVAPTLLKMMGLDQPPEMTGKPLF